MEIIAMVGSLKSSRLKLERARRHFNDAKSCLKSWTDELDKAGLRLFYLDLGERTDAGYYLVRFGRVEAPPTELSLIVGDCVHNLRSALDHLAWDIVPVSFRNDPQNEERLRQIGFPIDEDEKKREEQRWRSLLENKVPRTSLGQRMIIRSHQPFLVPKSQRPHHPLALLQSIDNTDKHRIILVTVVSTKLPLQIKSVFVTIGDFEPRGVEMLQPGVNMIARTGVEVARIHGVTLVGRERSLVSAWTETEGFIGFEDGYPLVDGLKSMSDEVEKIISEIEQTV